MLSQNIAKPSHGTRYVFMHMNDALCASARQIRNFGEIYCALGRTMLQIGYELLGYLAPNILLGLLGATPNVGRQNDIAFAFKGAIERLFDTLGLNREYI